MTMLIAGHETTAAVLTWATFELAQAPHILKQAQEEVDRVLGDRRPTLEVSKLTLLNRMIARVSLQQCVAYCCMLSSHRQHVCVLDVSCSLSLEVPCTAR
jgi:Cytochrome P450